MKASVYIQPQKLETREVPKPSLQDGDILLRVRTCGVCGSDIRKIQYNFIQPPAIFGHEVAGVVEEVGANVDKFEIGDRVVLAHHTPCFSCHYCAHGSYSMCREFKSSNIEPGGFAEFVRVPKKHVELTSFKIPDGMSFDSAIHMEPLGCIVRNLNRTRILPGDTVLCIGLGSVGILTGQLAKSRGAQVLATDLHSDRREIGDSLGFQTRDGKDSKLKDWVLSLTDGRGADLVVLTAGNPNVYSESIHWVRDGGVISVFAGLGPKEPLQFEANELYHREIMVYSSYSAAPADLEEALELLKNGSINVDVLHAKTFSLDNLSNAIEGIISQQILKAVVHP